LEKIFRTIGQSSDVITYNGFAYDMNVLRIRAAKLGITSASVIDS
jgi:predicted PolB exonuclease-like 3'-5' exonuclease